MHREKEEEQGIYNQYFNDLGVQLLKIEFPTMSRYKNQAHSGQCVFFRIVDFGR